MFSVSQMIVNDNKDRLFQKLKAFYRLFFCTALSAPTTTEFDTSNNR